MPRTYTLAYFFAVQIVIAKMSIAKKNFFTALEKMASSLVLGKKMEEGDTRALIEAANQYTEWSGSNFDKGPNILEKLEKAVDIGLSIKRTYNKIKPKLLN